jgi:hypothetical protein
MEAVGGLQIFGLLLHAHASYIRTTVVNLLFDCTDATG